MMRALERVLLLAFGAVMTLVIAEGILRLRYPRMTGAYQDLYVLDPEVGYKMRPGLETNYRTGEYATRITANALGFRDADHAPERSRDVTRILVLGDSMTEALQVPWETLYTEQLRADLRVRLERPQIELIRLAVGGYGLMHEYAAWRAYGRRYHPDLVLVTAVPNDIELIEGLGLPPTDPALREAVQRSAAGLYGTHWSRISRRLYSYFFLRNMLWQTAGGRRLLDTARRLVHGEDNADSGAPRAPDAWTALVADGQLAPELEVSWTAWLELLQALAEEIRATGPVLGVVMIPFREHVDADQLARFLRRAPTALDFDRAESRLRGTLEAAGIPYLPVSEEFRRSLATGRPLYWTYDRHLAAEGHRVLADLLVPWCAQLLAARGVAR